MSLAAILASPYNQGMQPPTRSWRLRPPARRLFIILGVGLCLLAVALLGRLYYLRYYLRMPDAGQGPAGPMVPHLPFTEVWSERPVLLLGLGDSIVRGLGARPGYTLFDWLAENPPDEFPDMQGICLSAVFPNLRMRNLAISGSTSLEHMKWQIPAIQEQPPDVLGIVIITTGGNDIIHPYGKRPPKEGAMYGATLDQAQPWIANFRHRLDEMVARIEAAFPGRCHIFLANIYDPTDGGGVGAVPLMSSWPDALSVLKAYNDELAGCAARHRSVHLVDIHGLFLGHGFRCDHFWCKHYHSDDPHFWYFSNVEDPNERGYDALRRLFLIKIAKAFGKMAEKGPTRAKACPEEAERGPCCPARKPEKCYCQHDQVLPGGRGGGRVSYNA
jgi:lysophospholipase L1-like esterase